MSLLRMSAEDRDSRKASFASLTERLIVDSGHMMHHDQPELVAPIIEDFLLQAKPRNTT